MISRKQQRKDMGEDFSRLKKSQDGKELERFPEQKKGQCDRVMDDGESGKK